LDQNTSLRNDVKTNTTLAINKRILILSAHLVNSMKRKIPPETPRATIKPFQKSVKKSLFISTNIFLP